MAKESKEGRTISIYALVDGSGTNKEFWVGELEA